MATFLQLQDEGTRAMLFTKFGADLGISNMVKDTALMPKAVAMRKIAEARGEVSTEVLNV